ncbi:MAG: 2-amino-4-hydroxy-6-hydroxymethyldihydropteridine diphosphokinase [Desulfobacteraceae bacterium]|nr:2-amino-4-hydroxy-6-hydroxymethyldihydropteridine diphosphokinase [Desulfobacteraceae bacterium]
MAVPELKFVPVIISLGSNLGNKKENLLSAIELLKEHAQIKIIDISPFYRTEPVDYLDQDWFVNAVLKAETTLEPENLLCVLKETEIKLKQGKKSIRFGPRIIDLDIIYYGEMIVNTKELVIPHPRMHKRCFVLKPLCDIETEIVHPVCKLKPNELLDELLNELNNKLDNKENQEVRLLN